MCVEIKDTERRSLIATAALVQLIRETDDKGTQSGHAKSRIRLIPGLRVSCYVTSSETRDCLSRKWYYYKWPK